MILVTASNDVKEKKAARSRQLKVLAGDYFSSRFYHLLAQAGQIEMIKQLSNAICEVNRSQDEYLYENEATEIDGRRLHSPNGGN